MVSSVINLHIFCVKYYIRIEQNILYISQILHFIGEHSDMPITFTFYNIYLFQLNNRSTRKTCKTYPKLTIKTPEQRQPLLFQTQQQKH